MSAMLTFRQWPSQQAQPKRGLPARCATSVMQCHARDMALLLDQSLYSENGKKHMSQISTERMGRETEWYGGLKSLDAVRDLLAHGWQEGANKIEKLSRELAAPLKEAENIRQRPMYGEQGDSLDSWRAMAGEWDTAWLGVSPSKRRGPRIVTITGAWGGNCGRTQDQMFWQGAQLLTATQLLEQAGYAVEVVAVGITATNPDSSVLKDAKHGLQVSLVTAKESGEPLRLDLLASAFAHAGVYRTAGFGAVLTSPTDFGSWYGYHIGEGGTFTHLAQLDPLALPEPEFYMPDAYSRVEAERGVKQLLDKLANRAAAQEVEA